MEGCSAVKSYLESTLAENPSLGCCQPDEALRGRERSCGLTEFSGSYVPAECQQGILGGPEYYRAYRESEMARMAPDVLGRSVRSSFDEGYMSMITPEKPAPVSLAGYDIFGPQSYSSTTRNMIMDLRGEAAYIPSMAGELPEGASIASMAIGRGDECECAPAGIRLPVGSQFGYSVPSIGPIARDEPFGGDDICLDVSQRPNSVKSVHPAAFFAPQRVQPVSTLRPFHVAL